MTEELDATPEPTADEAEAIAALLARADVWDEPPAGLEDDVVRAIAAARAERPAMGPGGAPTSTEASERPAEGRPSAMPWWLAAAAAVAVVVAVIAIATRGDDPGGTVVALAGTDAAPGASAVVELSSTPAGLKILLDADGLDGAPDGFYYEAWVTDGTTRVSAGTFHLRGGDGPIELWAGIVDPGFDRLSITLEPIDGDTDTSGDVRLTGTFRLADG